MSFRRSFVFGALISGLMLTGFGCKKIDTNRPNVTGNLGNGQITLPTISVNTKATEEPKREIKPERKPHAEILRLRDVMKSFQKSQSFRADITIGGPDGVKGEIAYNQPNGMFGKLMLKNGFTSELAVKDKRVAVRNGTSTWQEITDTPESQYIANLFESITNRAGSEPLYPDENARYTSVKDDPRGCKLHSFSQFMGNVGSYQPIQLCVANGLPVYFSIPSQDGLIEIVYKDIDQPVQVFFPLP